MFAGCLIVGRRIWLLLDFQIVQQVAQELRRALGIKSVLLRSECADNGRLSGLWRASIDYMIARTP